MKITCKKCSNSWTKESDDPDPYFCHRCGYDNEKNEFDMSKLAKWWMNQKSSLKKLFEDIFNINNYKN
jgi:hypothetical protein